MNFGQRLRLCRKNASLTQQELGRKVQVAESTISLYETNKRSPDKETLNTLARCLNVSVSFLLGNVADETNPDDYPFTEQKRNLPKSDLNAFLEQKEITFNGAVYRLTEEERKTVVKSLEVAFYGIQQRQKTK